MPAVALSILAFIVALAALFRALFDRYEMRGKIAALALEASEAKRLLVLRTQLAAEIAHEIKNPMTAIISSVEALDLLIGKTLEPDLQKSLAYIRENGHHTMKLLSDFLEINKFNLGDSLPKPERVFVTDAVESISGLLRSYALKKHISLVATGMENKSCAYVDPRHLKQILFNLMHNALKFTDDRGTVSISVTEDTALQQIRIIVQDTGTGISQKEISRIFEPFVQGHIKNPNDIGVGLGLALCKRLVNLAGGEIKVTSARGVGTAFEFWLPKYVNQTRRSSSIVMRNPSITQATPPTPPMVEEPMIYQPLIGQAFLIVDDNNQSRVAIAKLIEAWGGLVDQVSQAADAVDALARRNYDAVMVDKTAEGLHGYELATLIRDQATNKGTTIILASDEPVDKDLAHDCGVDKCIEKPLRGEELLRSLISTGKFQITH